MGLSSRGALESSLFQLIKLCLTVFDHSLCTSFCAECPGDLVPILPFLFGIVAVFDLSGQIVSEVAFDRHLGDVEIVGKDPEDT